MNDKKALANSIGAQLTEDECTELARIIFPTFQGTRLADAEDVIENIRRLLWMHAFSGAPFDELYQHYGRFPLAKEIGERLSGFSLLTVEAVLQELRFGLYVPSFATVKGSRWNRLLASRAEEQARYAEPPSGATKH